MGKDRETTFFQTHFMHQRQAKIGPGPKEPPPKKKNSKVFVRSSQTLPMFLTEKPSAAQQTQAPTLNTAHSWRELWGRETELTNQHTELPVCPQALYGDNATTHSSTQALWEAGREQPAPPSRWGALKNPQTSHPQDLVMSLGFGNQANEEARAKISNFCQTPGKAHCYQ